jgi:hypothetical protein
VKKLVWSFVRPFRTAFFPKLQNRGASEGGRAVLVVSLWDYYP